MYGFEDFSGAMCEFCSFFMIFLLSIVWYGANVNFYGFLEKCDKSGLKMIEKCDFGLIFDDLLWFFDEF